MSDLADLAAALTKDLPVAARKVIDTALEHGWELNAPGMTVALRLNHPTDELAAPVYICWAVKKTPTGKVGFSFNGCSTSAFTPLRPADLLEYLADPTIAYTIAEEGVAAAQDKLDNPPWDNKRTPEENVIRMTGGTMIGFEVDRPPRKGRRESYDEIQARVAAKMAGNKEETSTSPGQPAGSPAGKAARPLRVAL